MHRQVIALKVLNLNSDTNKSLMNILNKHVSGVVRAGMQFSIKFAKSDGKTSYPRAVFRGDTYVGVAQISECIIEALQSKRVAPPPEDEDLYRQEAMNTLSLNRHPGGGDTGGASDSDASDYGTQMSAQDIEKGMERFNKQRERFGAPPVAVDSDSDMPPPPPRKSSGRKGGKKAVPPSAQSRPSSASQRRKSGKKNEAVIESLQDEDIGETFRQQKFGSAKEKLESDLLENMFANMQSTAGT